MAQSKRLAVARRLVVDHRLSLFPLREGGKLPAIKGWQEAATLDAEKLEKWFGKGERNIGVATGPSGLIVIDTDQKDGRDGDANLRALAGSHQDDLDGTFTVESPTGSRHYYFRGDPVRDSVGKLADAVDIRSKGGLVVAPGSSTAKGTYRVIRNLPISTIPQWLVQTIAQKYVQAEKVELKATVELDTPAAYSTVLAYLATVEGAVEGQGGNDATYRVAARLKDMGVSEAGALDCMDLLSDWNARCSPPWDRDELQDVIEHAYAYGENSPGSDSVELNFDEITDDMLAEVGKREAPAGGRITILFDHQIKAGLGKRRVYIIKGILSEGDLGIIFGKPGAGKSLIAPYMARMITQGKPAFGRRTKLGTVFYIAAEDPAGMTERIEALQIQCGEAEGFALITGVSNLAINKSPDVVALLPMIKQHRPKVIFIDTLAMAFPGIDENTAEGMGRVIAICKVLARYGAAVILIHHDTKEGSDTPRGHSILDGALDMKLKLTKAEGKEVITGKLGKNRNGSQEWQPAFRIGVQELGVDEDGDKITAAYADEVKTRNTSPGKKLPAAVQAALDLFIELDDGTGVDRSAWRSKCCDDVSAMSAADDKDTRLRVFRRCLQELLARKLLVASGKKYALAGGGGDFEEIGEEPFPADPLET